MFVYLTYTSVATIQINCRNHHHTIVNRGEGALPALGKLALPVVRQLSLTVACNTYLLHHQ